ncbi:MAG: winged helix-turn-helix transcriptional regulator [Gemmobacter sp.]
MPQRKLADMLGLSVQTVSRAYDDLIRRGQPTSPRCPPHWGCRPACRRQHPLSAIRRKVTAERYKIS